MVEVAEADDDKWDSKNVSVVPASPGTKAEWRVPYFALKGLVSFLFCVAVVIETDADGTASF